MGRLARGGALNLVGAACAGLCGIGLVLVVARTQSQDVAGAFFAAVSLFVILTALAGLGSDAGLVRWLPRHLALGDPRAARQMLPIALVPVVTVAVVAAVAVSVTAPAIAELFGATDPGATSTMLRVLALFLPLSAAHEVLLAATRGLATMRPTVLIEKICRQVGQVGGIALVGLLSEHPAHLALAWALPYAVSVPVAALWYRSAAARTRPTAAAGEKSTTAAAPEPAADVAGAAALRTRAAEFWRYTAPRAGAQICQTMLQRADIVLLAALASPRDAAVYTAATRFIVIGQLATQAVQQVMQPMISRLLTLHDHPGAQRVFTACTTWIVVLTWPVLLTVAAGAAFYLQAFGGAYADQGLTATVVLALTMLVATACGPVDVMLLMAGRSGLSLANNVAALVVNLALNVVLIPQYGATGAAIAWSAALLTRNLLPLAQVRSLLGMTPFGAPLAWAVGGSVVCFGVVQLPVITVFDHAAGAFTIALLAGVTAYLAGLWSGRERLELTAFAALLPGRRGRATAGV